VSLTGIRFEVNSILRSSARAFPKNSHTRLPGGFGLKWRMSVPQIRPKPKRGATNATSIAVVKIARTTLKG
jgi:hypothetical protein